MPGSDTLTRLNDWRTLLYRGSPSHLDRFLAAVDSTLPLGWKRDPSFEAQHLLTARCYAYDQPGDAVIGVLLNRTPSPTRLRGGVVRVYRNPLGPTERIGALVGEIADTCVLPAAHAVGLQYARPRFGARSIITSVIESLFNQVADSADGVWPLPEIAKASWDDLISLGLAEQVAIDQQELERWAIENGWTQTAAAQLARQFFADSDWLARRMAVVAP
jgi:hypothetical protein